MLTSTYDNPGDFLNCRSVGALAPRGSVVFAMRLQSYPWPKAGPQTLLWHLDDGTAKGITAKGKLEIVAKSR